jgi:hypothetical protein
MELALGTNYYKHDSRPLSSQRLINGFVEIGDKEAKSQVSVHGCVGISNFATVGSGPIRGGLEMNGVAYFVSGAELYSVDEDGAGLLLGTGITGVNNVAMAGNGFEIIITNGVNGFSYLLSSGTFEQIADGDFQVCNTVTVINSIFAFDRADTNKFFISGVLDGRTYDALDEASAESSPDNVVAVRERGGILMVFGEKTTEPWANTGASDFPFSRVQGSTIKRGLAAPLALEDEDNAVFFLGEDRIFYRMDGLRPQRVSNFALEREWTTYETVRDAFCFKVATQGHKFIHLTFPTEGATFCFDVASRRWHERMSWDSGGQEVRWRASCAVNCYSKTLIGDANSGKIGMLDPTIYTEFGEPIILKMTLPPIYGKGRRIFVPKLEVDIEPGVGIADGQGEDPQLMLDMSTDGGFNYSLPQQWSSMGPIGDYGAKVWFDRLGSADQFTFRLSISDPVKRVITGARCPGLYFGSQ